jgi:protein tyrosine phosphatase (PTP) superfamily phosphohydrolase (DUF442 family)
MRGSTSCCSITEFWACSTAIAITECLWRSAQPTPGDLKSLQEKGPRSVICVRGGRAFGSWPLEKEVCERMNLGLHKVAIPVRSKHLASRTC